MESNNLPNRTRKHIRFLTIVKMAVSNIRFKRFRSIITILGVVIGVGSVYMLVSFGLGLQILVQDNVIGNQTINTVDITPANSTIIKLEPQNLQQIKSIANVSDVSGVYILASQVTLDGSSVDLVTYGIDSLYLKLSNLNLLSGRILNPSSSDEIIINSSLLNAVGIKDIKTAIGKEIGVKFTPKDGLTIDKKMRVVGIIDSGAGSEIFVSQKVFQEANVQNFSQAKAVIDNRDSIADARRSIESLGYETTSPVDTLNQINEVFRIFNISLIGLGSIGMIIAFLSMLNTLTISLLERVREIALMMTIGARPKDMQLLITAEAVILSLTGSVVGVLSAGGLGALVNLVLNQSAKSRGVVDGFNLFSNPFLIVLATLTLMVLVGVVVSYVPARRAARINPVKAMRQN